MGEKLEDIVEEFKHKVVRKIRSGVPLVVAMNNVLDTLPGQYEFDMWVPAPNGADARVRFYKQNKVADCDIYKSEVICDIYEYEV